MRLLPSSLDDDDLVQELIQICGTQFVSSSQSDRILYARDMWPRSLIRQRFGSIDSPPGLVVHPQNSTQIARIVQVAAARGVPLVAFGAGSGVCGGTLPVAGGIVLDLKRLNKLVSIHKLDHLAEVEVGMLGEVLERELNQRGFTLGHFPSSIYCSTVGGWLAGRSAGQCSSRYGKIEDMCRSLQWVDAQGEIHSSELAARPSAWRLDPLLLGSEGTLGIITKAKLVIRPLRQERFFRAFRFPRVEDGLVAMRSMLRSGLRPSVLRLYDEFDTLIAKTSSSTDKPDDVIGDSLVDGLGRRVQSTVKKLLGHSLKRALQTPRLLNSLAARLPSGCLMVVVYEDELSENLDLVGGLITQMCLETKAQDLGAAPAQHWWDNRYNISYKQSGFFTSGAFVDTMEVAGTWDRLGELYHSVRSALSKLAFVMAHFSHAYRSGGSIYFSFAAAAADDAAAAALYDRIWDAAQSAVLAHGGVVSHHHGVGLSKARYLLRQLGQAQQLSQTVKQVFDPQGILNPGKLGHPTRLVST